MIMDHFSIDLIWGSRDCEMEVSLFLICVSAISFTSCFVNRHGRGEQDRQDAHRPRRRTDQARDDELRRHQVLSSWFCTMRDDRGRSSRVHSEMREIMRRGRRVRASLSSRVFSSALSSVKRHLKE